MAHFIGHVHLHPDHYAAAGTVAFASDPPNADGQSPHARALAFAPLPAQSKLCIFST